jgi:hypothetical protein
MSFEAEQSISMLSEMIGVESALKSLFIVELSKYLKINY